ncbi:hypothetical protein [Streptomyces sp. NBC_00102]|uniref:hypothetical protein n=1 Tax=Streptomyces sp. NBC_00102 TaxID=2975652 RepID=UPI002252C4E2|nr:hypothetical protein [Streptomyces sp. NBC_00102]MCX5401197.1 hypothetical protein [Streptomyces sp. NBC_00102]
MALGPKNRRAGEAPDLDSHRTGHVLLVHARGALDEQALAFAAGLPEDPDHHLVVLDLPAGFTDAGRPRLARLLGRRDGGYRLVFGRRPTGGVLPLGQWLADRLDRTVLVADGAVTPAAGGVLYVPADSGSGWVRLRPNRPGRPESRRFPKPVWEFSVADQPWHTSDHAVADPLPSGVWLHPVEPETGIPAHRARLEARLACGRELLTVVLGCPGTPALGLDDVSRFWASVLPGARPQVRFFPYGPLAAPGKSTSGQALADRLDSPVVLYNGMPVGRALWETPQVHTVDTDGTLGFAAFAKELRYLPARMTGGQPAAPAVLSHRPVVDGIPQIAPGVYRYAPDAVLEVIPGGLWMRPPEEPDEAPVVRSAPADPRHFHLVHGTVARAGARMRELAENLLDRMDPVTRGLARLMPANRMVQESSPPRPPTALTAAPPPEIRARLLAPSAPPVASEPPVTPDSPVVVESPVTSESYSAAELYAAAAPGPRTRVFVPAPAAPPEGAAPAPSVTGVPATTGPAAPATRAAALAPGTTAALVPGAAAPPTGTATAPPAGLLPAPAPVPAPRAAAPGALWETTAAAAEGAPAPETHAPDAFPPTATAAEPVVRTAAPNPLDPSAPLDPPDVAHAPDTPAPPAGGPPPAPFLPSLRLVSAPGGAPAPVPASPPEAAAERAVPHPGPQPPPPAPEPESTPPSRAPAPAGRAAADPAGRPRPQPVPTPAACALPPAKGIAREREWLRGAFRQQYDDIGGAVARVLSQSPGLRGTDRTSTEDVLTDLVAARLYLRGDGALLDDAVRGATVGPHVPLARCVTSGLRRLPSYRGATLMRAALSETEWAWYARRRLVTEWGFGWALTSAAPGLPGDTDVLVWSTTARRTALLDPEPADRVLFLPGTSFKVLSTRDGERRTVLLRELSASEVDAEGRVDIGRTPLDEIALSGLGLADRTWRATEPEAVPALPDAVRGRFGVPPGLIVGSGPAAPNTLPERG